MSTESFNSHGVRVQVYCQLSDEMSIAIDTGNFGSAVKALDSAGSMYRAGLLDVHQYAELREDFLVAYPDSIL